jgi:hypothetical protein
MSYSFFDDLFGNATSANFQRRFLRKTVHEVHVSSFGRLLEEMAATVSFATISF